MGLEFNPFTGQLDKTGETKGVWGYQLDAGLSVTIDAGQFWLVIGGVTIDGHVDLNGRMVSVD